MKRETNLIRIILKGKCQIICPFAEDDKKEVMILKAGDVFGESDFLRISVRMMN